MSEFIPEQPGSFRIELSKADPATKAWLCYRCPCGCGSAGQLPLVQPMSAAHDNHTWNWDGNYSIPTLSPSIRRNVECKFHGHLQKGMWTACEDGPPIAKDVWRPGAAAPVDITRFGGQKVESVIIDDPLNQEPAVLQEPVADIPKEPSTYVVTDSDVDRLQHVTHSMSKEPVQSEELRKLIEDMTSDASETARQILHGERAPPPEFEKHLAALQQHFIEGETQPDSAGDSAERRAVIFCGEYHEAFDYMIAQHLQPSDCTIVSNTTYQQRLKDLNPAECYIVTVGTWESVDGVREAHAKLLKRWQPTQG